MHEDTLEYKRLMDATIKQVPHWKKWGPYVSERSWGTVREDYSADGDAWSYTTHEMARSKAYRWGEDGIAGISDYYQRLAFSVAFWNEKDPILKERLFGLNAHEGNHGEDVKECYYYLDATPTHSYLKYLYKYPQKEFPYADLLEENKKRSAADREYELYDTGIFNEGRYFDIFIEYAKASEEDHCIRIQIWNRGPEAARIHVVPQIWFRNTWSWTEELGFVPSIKMEAEGKEVSSILVDPTGMPLPAKINYEYQVPPLHLYGKTPQEILFTNNETHNEKIWGPKVPSRTPYVKDAFHRTIIQKERCVNPQKEGTKAAFHYGPVTIDPGQCHTILLRLSPEKLSDPLKDVESTIELRKKEADAFYASVQKKNLSEEDKIIQRRAIAGMIWSKQLYIFDVKQWLDGDNPKLPPPPGRVNVRNGRWRHLYAVEVFSMPDKWEYPWFAAWDLAFHTLSFALVDLGFAKMQLHLLLTQMYQNANGQIPAYEWGFSDLNPPVQAWALWKLYSHEQATKGKGDRVFLQWGFLKLMHNFDWWVNKVDRFGNNIFEGGFLGLDNISVIDRSKPLLGGGTIEQSDGTGWMGFYSLMLMRIALELSKEEPIFQSIAVMFFEHFAAISKTIHEKNQIWDEEDGFFYDMILYPDGRMQKLKIRSFVGIIPFYSLFSFTEEELKSYAHFYDKIQLFIRHTPKIMERSMITVEMEGKKKYLFSLMDLGQIQRMLSRVFDPNEFLSDYGLRSLSKYHEKNPFVFEHSTVSYEPGESLERIKGGNSNWRGPIWYPTNFLFLNSLEKLTLCLGKNYQITMSDNTKQTLGQLVNSLKQRLVNTFRRDKTGKRAVHGEFLPYQNDPYWKDLLLFYEHYHGDTGRGLGASHQTGWSGLVANVIDLLE